jgi:hypothetical protein
MTEWVPGMTERTPGKAYSTREVAVFQETFSL